MSDLTQPCCRVHEIDPAAIPGMGPRHVLSRLTHGSLDGNLPLLNPEQAPAFEPSPFLDRSALADALAATNRSLGNELDDRQLAAIRGDGVMVIAGQQPGLLLSPAYILMKAISAIALARDLERRMDRPVLPAFWIAGEDHDVAEVNRCTIAGRKFVVGHEQAQTAGPRPPVATLSLQPWRSAILEFLDQALTGLPHRAAVTELVRSARFDDYTTHAGQLLANLAGHLGLVLVDPMRLRPLQAPVIAEMAQRWTKLQTALSRGSDRIRKLALEPPLDRLNLFRIDEAGRQSIDDPASLSAKEIEKHPDRFSPGAALRPIVQDATLPTVATLAGPTELTYLWQIDPLYRAMNLSRSATHPRLSATLVEPTVIGQAERFGFPPDRLLSIHEAVDAYDPRSFIEDGDGGKVQRIEAAREELLRAIEALDGETGSDGRLRDRAERSIRYQVEKVIDRILMQRLSRRGLGKDRLKQIADRVRPGGQFQERTVSSMELIARFGPAITERLAEVLEPYSPRHRLIEVEPTDQREGV